MEDEAFFLFVVYQLEGHPVEATDGKLFYDFTAVIRKATLQKQEDHPRDLYYKRINVDFDPLLIGLNRTAYVVGIQAKAKSDKVDAVLADKLSFPIISLNKGEAELVKQRIDDGEYRNYLKKGEKFLRSFLTPVIILDT